MAEAPNAPPVLDELERAQAELGRALGRARVGESADLSQRVRELGEGLARVLAGLLKLSRVHAPSNRALDAPVAELGRLLRALDELLGPVHLVLVEDQVYVNDVRVRFDARAGGRELAEALSRHEAGGLAFHAPLDVGEIRRLVATLGAPAAPEARRAALGRALVKEGVKAVEPEPIHRFRTGTEGDPPPAAGVAHPLLVVVRRAFDAIAAGRVLNVLPLRRAIVSALDAGLASRELWAPAPPEAPLYAAHAVQVATAALVIGRRAGFTSSYLQDLGVAALVHDAGYFAAGLAEAPDAFARHPLEGARVMLRQRGFHEGKLRRLRGVLEHHRDLRGTPTPSVTGAILRVAEDYATLTRLHAGELLRAQILGAMLRAPALYHPPLVQLLVNALGLHPPGTLVELDDGRRGRVAAPVRSRETWDRPLVELLEADGATPTGAVVDCAAGPGVRAALRG
jgi:hypothetical protein